MNTEQEVCNDIWYRVSIQKKYDDYSIYGCDEEGNEPEEKEMEELEFILRNSKWKERY